jgi:acyl-CoA thioester hydrolase
MNQNKTQFRVRYSDTDHFGVVYYANYLNWLEAGRTEILRDNGISYKDYEKQGFFAPVVKLEVEWKNSARYDDIVCVETKIEKIGTSSIEFSYNIYRECDNLQIAKAKTVNVFITKEGRTIKVPEGVRKILGN